MAANGWYLGVLNELEGVRSSSVFCDGNITIVDLLCEVFEHNVLEYGAKSHGIIYLWFLLFAQVDAFGVTTAFNVENSIVSPNMLIITDKESVISCRKCRFPSSR